ncbi:MAG: AraC family transcriptional regulator [Saprospiraceae bacterium]|nr:AraC family transcriptional regulator [Saprospiraceae bacterium]
MIYLGGLAIAFFLCILILLKKGKTGPDYVLLVWMGVLVIHLLLFYLHFTGGSYAYPFILGWMLPLPVLHGVFLYAYTAELTGSGILKKRWAPALLLPFILLVALCIPFLSLSGSEKVAVFQHGGRGFEWYSAIQLLIILVSGFAYSVAVVVKIRRYRRKVLNTFSNSDHKLLKWLEYLAAGLGAIWGLSAFFDDPVIFGGVVCFVLFIGFFGINQVPVFYSNHGIAPLAETQHYAAPALNPVRPEKYAKTGLREEEAQGMMARLEALMQVEKPFQNSDHTLNDLAELLGVPPGQLSQVVNSMTGNNFHHYINSRRIEEFLVVAALPKNKKYTLLALAYDCGFNAKSTFNKYFKLQTGQTPSEYFDPGRSK